MFTHFEINTLVFSCDWDTQSQKHDSHQLRRVAHKYYIVIYN